MGVEEHGSWPPGGRLEKQLKPGHVLLQESAVQF